MSIFDIFKKQTAQEHGFGANLDTRPEEEREKDVLQDEFVSSIAPVRWEQKTVWRKFPIYDQNGSGSCVAQTAAKMLGIMYWLLNNDYVHFSATHIYQRRINKPAAGMGGTDVATIAAQGVTLEELVPSQKMTDSQMDAVMIAEYKKKVGEVFKAGQPIFPSTKSIDTIASTIQVTGKPVMVWYYFSNGLKPIEWNKSVPTLEHKSLPIAGKNTVRHSVTAVDFLILSSAQTTDNTLWGKKALVIEDSWGPDNGREGQRFITEDFHTARNFFAMYFMNFNFDSSNVTDKPKYTFNKNLQFSSAVSYGNADVIALQNVLKYEGLFPTNVESTGYFGAATRNAVIQFQLKYGIKPAEGFVGAKTRAKLNELYS